MMRFTQILLGVCLCWVMAEVAEAQEKLANLPTNPANWINSPPIPISALKGKAAIFYYYEEGCPNCRAKWPALLAVANKYQGKPILFVAVNSGNDRASVARYAAQCKINWPVIVDTDRSFEKLSQIPEISLNNIYQCKSLTGDGKFVGANPGNLEGVADQLLSTASWNVDPEGIPASMQQAWMGVEFGSYAKVASIISASLKSPKEDVKAAAETLNNYVQEQIKSKLEAANSVKESNKWQAYKLFNELDSDFKGYEVPDDVKQTVTELAKDEAVKKELQAFKRLEAAQKMLSSRSIAARKRGVSQLELIIKDDSGTEAATTAQEFLTQMNASQ